MAVLIESEGKITITVKNNLINYYNNLLYNNLLNSTVICDKYKYTSTITNETYLQLHSFYTFIPESNVLKFKLTPEDHFQRTKFIINDYTSNPQECIYFNNITGNFSVDYLIALNGSNNVDLVASMFGTDYLTLISNILSNTDGSKQAVYFNNVTLNSTQNYEALVIHALPRYKIPNNQAPVTLAPFKFFGASESNNSSNLTLKYLFNISNSSFTTNSFIKFHIYETLILCSCDEKNGDGYKILTTKIVDPNTTYKNNLTICLS
jgi:hypothetical protein